MGNKKDVSVKVAASQTQSFYSFSFEELGVTKYEWEQMSDKAKEDFVQIELNNLPEQPYWVVDKINYLTHPLTGE